MEELFLQILNMSLISSGVIVAVLLLRLPLKKAPKSISYALWSVVLFRLICPFSFESIFSLIPSAKPLPKEVLTAPNPVINSGFPVFDKAINLPAPTPTSSATPMQALIFISSIVWLIGIAVLLIYSVISYLLLKRKVRTAMLMQGNIYECDAISSPFVLGIIKPKIYLPLGLSALEKAYILKHEQTHIKRLDTLIKPIAFLALCVHWFNPLCWLAFIIMSKDMELSCDESVLKAMGNAIKCDYSTSLLSLATKQKMLNGSPLAFGESNVTARIKNVLSYKKPAFWVVAVAIVAVIAVGIGLIANPKARAANVFGVKAVSSTKSGEALSDDEIDTISRKAFANASLIFSPLYFSPIELERDEKDSFIQDDATFYRLTQFKTIAQYKALCTSVFSTDFYNNTIWPAAQSFLLERNGKLYISPDKLGGGGGYTQLTMAEDKITAVIKEQNKLIVAANTKGLVPTENGFADGVLEYTLVNENGNWVLNNFYGESATSSPYSIDILNNGDVQISFANTADFAEFSDKNGGSAFYDKANSILRVQVLTGIGEPIAPTDSPVVSLAGAGVTFEVDLQTADKPLNVVFTQSEAPKNATLNISDDRLVEIAMSFYSMVEQALQKNTADALIKWAQGLDTNGIKSIELITEPAEIGKRYKQYEKKDFASIVALINESQGTFMQYNETIEGNVQSLYITQNDGSKHTVTNAGNKYLIIDGQFYAGQAQLLEKWSFKGDAMVPAAFGMELPEPIVVKDGEVSPQDFVDAIVQSFQIKDGIVRFTTPQKNPSGFELSQLSILVSSSMPMGDGSNMSLHAYETENESRKWQLGHEYIEKMFDAKVPDGTEVYINVSLNEKDEGGSRYYAGASKIFPLREDHFTPTVKTTANTVAFTNRFNDTLTLNLSLPKGFTLQAPASGDAIEYTNQGYVSIYNGDAFVGTIHYNDFVLVRDENGDIPYMSVYNSLMLGSVASWDGEYTPIVQTKDTCTAVCKPWHRIDVPGVSGAALANATDKGIVAYDAKLLKYVAIFLDDNAVTQAQLEEIAKSVKLS